MSDGPLSPEEVAHRGFGTTFRGFDTAEVRAYLQRVANDLRAGTARERDLHKRVADAEHRAAHPVLEGDALTRALGDEMGRILASAQEAANGLKDKAEENAARILREAHEQAQRIRAQAEAILAVRTEEADAEAAEIRRLAAAEAAGLVERAGDEASAAMADVESRARQLVHDAQAARARVLGDLTRRRRLLQTQVEQLRAGRDRLLEAYRKVRSTTDEVAEELQRVEDEARAAAGAAGERAAAGAGGDDLDDVLAAFAAASVPDGDGSSGPAAATGGAGEGASAADGPLDQAAAAPAGAPAGGAAPGQDRVPFAVKVEVAAQLARQATDEAEAAALITEAAAPVDAEGSAAADAEPAPRVVSTRPGGERRPLRLLRRSKEGRPLDVVPPPADDEAVRVLPPSLEPAVAAASTSAPAPTGDQAAADKAAPTTTGGENAGVGAAAATGGPPAAAAPVPAAGTGEADAAAGGPVGATAPPAAEAQSAPPALHTATPGEADAADAPPAVHTATPGEADAAAAAVAGVDELFARIRAGRADAVARAHEVLTPDPGAPVPPEAAGQPPPAAADADNPEPGGPGEDESLLRRRDTAVEGLEAKLARKLKRALQDEQNEVLDRLRSAKAGARPDAVLPASEEQAGRYGQAAEEALRASAAAGMAFMSDGGAGAQGGDTDISGVLTEMVSSLAEPLRRALERAMGGDGADQTAVVERIGAAYRECKAQRIEGLAGDAVTAAFSCGALAAMPAGTASRWVVDDDGRPCPDCDDNALAGPTPAGEAFPTGQAHPPAHAGCRCLLAAEAVMAAVRGNG